MRWISCVVIAGALAGCDSGAPSCNDAVAKAFATTGGMDDKHADSTARMLVDTCKSQGWSGTVRTCLANAHDGRAADACFAKLDGAQMRLVRDKLAAETARLEAATAELRAQQAEIDARGAAAQVDRIEKDLDGLNDRVARAVSAVVDAQNEDDRAAALAKLKQLQAEQYTAKQRVEAARAAAVQAERMKGVHLSKECIDNPLARGCS
jgi:hypothetical protein